MLRNHKRPASSRAGVPRDHRLLPHRILQCNSDEIAFLCIFQSTFFRPSALAQFRPTTPPPPASQPYTIEIRHTVCYLIMASSRPIQSAASQDNEADFAQAFKDLAKGERTAAAMESQLTALERKIDDLLASVDPHATSAEQMQPKTEDKSTSK